MVHHLLLCLLSPLASAAETTTYRRALERIEYNYLKLDEFKPSVAHYEAAEAAEDEVPWLIVESDGKTMSLRHGDKGEFARIEVVADDTSHEGFEALLEALAELEDTITAYGEPIPEDVDLPVELLRGVSRALDRHSVVLAREKLESFDERIKGRLHGIGAKIGQLGDEQLTVKGVFRDSPAARGGLLKGDVILRIDGLSTTGMSTAQATERIKGDVGTVVVLDVRRTHEDGRKEELSLSLVRDEVVIPNVEWEVLPGPVGLISISHFSENTEDLLVEALGELEEAKVGGVIIDLRGNTGGSMIQSAKSADLFVEDGLLIQTLGRDGEPVPNLISKIHAHDDGTEPDVPVAVLINSRSASASEIMGGALSLLERAVLIGSNSFGKGTVQKVYTLRHGDDQVRLKLTVAEYWLTDGVPVDHVGLQPDVWVEHTSFSSRGVSLPSHEGPEERTLDYVDEQDGWREGSHVDERPDVLIDVASRAMLSSAGPSRYEVMEALDGVLDQMRVEEDELLKWTYRHRDIDWSPADEGGGAPQADVEVRTMGTAVAGEEVEVRAHVHNTGTSPLYRVRVRLAALDDDLPWSGLTLPVGFVPPGEEAVGVATVGVPGWDTSREDQVSVTLEADRRTPVALDPVVLKIRGSPAPPLGLTGRLAQGPAGAKVLLDLINRGDTSITEVTASLAYPDDERIELLQQEDSIAVLPAQGKDSLQLAIKLPQPLDTRTVDLQVKLSCAEHGNLQHFPLVLPVDGSAVDLIPPTVRVNLPASMDTGETRVWVRAADERKVDEVTVWWGRDKVAWHSGTGRTLSFEVPIDVTYGTRALTVEVVDDQDVHTLESYYVRGIVPQGIADDEPAP